MDRKLILIQATTFTRLSLLVAMLAMSCQFALAGNSLKITGPNTLKVDQVGAWTATPSGNPNNYTYQWLVNGQLVWNDHTNALSYYFTGAGTASIVCEAWSSSSGWLYGFYS